MGWPKDAFTMEPVIDGTIVELLTTDSVLIKSVTPEWDTRYRPNSCFSVTIQSRPNTYIIRLRHPDYEPLTKCVTVKVGKRETTFSLGFLKMRRKPAEKTLGEATVTATKVKFYTRGDTLVYNADAFNLAEGSMLDALIEQLPGAELKRDGRIFVDGKQVESLLLNGKDFFKNDNTVLLDNLPGYAVDKIKVYNKQSNRNELLGHAVDDGTFVMDVNLKRQYQVGWLANSEAGGGTHDRWIGRLFALRFTPQSRLSLFAAANNVNESRKPGRNGEWSPEDVGIGQYTTRRGGVDYYVQDKHSRFQLEGDVTASHTTGNNESRQTGENFLASGNTFSQWWNSGGSRSTYVSTQHRLRFRMGPENKKRIDLNIRPRLEYSRNRGWNENLSAEFNSNPLDYANLRDSLSLPQAGVQLSRMLINRLKSEQLSYGHTLNGGVTADLSLLIPYTSDYMSLSGGISASHSASDSYDLYLLDYASSAADRRHRYYVRPSNRLNATAGLVYTRALTTDWAWVVTPRFDYEYRHDTQENSLYRLDRIEEMADAALGMLPSTQETLLACLDADNSYLTTQDTHLATFSLRGRWDKELRENGQRVSRWRFTWDPRIVLQSDRLKYAASINRVDKRTAMLPSVHLELLRNTPGMKHEVEVRADYEQALPSMFSLLGLRFDDDPLNVQEGNSSLCRTNTYSLTANYRADQWLAVRKQRLSANASIHAYQNAVATGYVFDVQTGTRTFQPQNINGNWDATAGISFSTPLGKQHRLELRASLQDNYLHSVDLSGLSGSEPGCRLVRTNYLQVPVSLEYGRGKWKLGAKMCTTWHHAASNREDFRTVDAADLSYGVYGQTQLPWNMQVASDFTFYSRHGYSDELMNSLDVVWNAQVSKSFLQGRLIFTLVGFDILGQLSGITYSLNAQGRKETWCNVIPRYAMLRVAYRLNVQPKKR